MSVTNSQRMSPVNTASVVGRGLTVLHAFRSLKKSVSESPVDRSYSIECDHHIDHNDTYYTISERNDELFIFF